MIYMYAKEACIHIDFQSRDATRSLASSSSTTNKQHRPSSTSSSASPGSGGGGGTALTASGSGAVIASLRGKIHSLERALREKESALGSLKREVNATRLREMEIQCETYYREITRCVHACVGVRGVGVRGIGVCVCVCVCLCVCRLI